MDLGNRAVPSLDPFTFASADRPWVDLQWLFPVDPGGRIRHLGGVPGVILDDFDRGAPPYSWWSRPQGSSSGRPGSSLLAGCRALVVMSRIASPATRALLAAGGWASLLRSVLVAEPTPPPGSSGLLAAHPGGPYHARPPRTGLLLLKRLSDRATCWISAPSPRHRPGRMAGQESLVVVRRWCGRHLVGIARCLVNPYGLRGALFPFELFPKITAWGGLYKSHISEFGDLEEIGANEGGSWAAGSLCMQPSASCF